MKKILIILENAYSTFGGKFKHCVYPSKYAYKKNKTYSRILPHVKDFDVYFAECTPHLGKNPKTKFEPDLDWIKKAINTDNWDAVIPCSVVACKALEEIGYIPFAKLPHPVSFQWRKQNFLDIIEKLR